MLIAQTFVFSYLWAVGGNLTENYWDSFDTFVRGQFDDMGEAKVRKIIFLENIYFTLLDDKSFYQKGY